MPTSEIIDCQFQTSILKQRYHSIWPFALALVVFAASGQSSLATPNTGFSYDKITHFLVFGLLATSIVRIPYFLNKHWKGALQTILIVSLYGAMDEFRQMFTIGRYVEFKDWIADTSGAILASALYLKWNRYRHALEKNFLSKKSNASADG